MPSQPHAARVLVTVTGFRKTYGKLVALDGVGFSVHSEEVLGLIGPNGAGKTTLFECLAGVQPVDRGEVVIDPSLGARRADALFYLPDAISPWCDQSVGWALTFTLRYFGGRADLHADVVQQLELSGLLGARIGALSKGQRKRALLAIGLLTPQRILLIDEPFEGLDLRQSREIARALRRYASAGRTLFLSIHQIAQAARVCDRFVLLSAGRVCAVGTAGELTALAAGRAGAGTADDFEEVFLALT